MDAIAAIQSHLTHGSLHDGPVSDAVRMRPLEIGEAAKALPGAVVAREREVAWRDIIGMRDHLAHRDFDTVCGIVEKTVREDVPVLDEAVRRLLDRR